MKSAARPFLSAFRGRMYSVQAATQSVEHTSLPKQGPKISRLPNGAVVVSLENYSPLSRVGVLYNAGSRYEEGINEGITHTLRAAATLSSKSATSFAITRNIQQIGGNLTCSTSREHMIYMLECKRDNLDVGVEFLGHVATSPAFKPWEVNGLRFLGFDPSIEFKPWSNPKLKERLSLELALLGEQPQAQLMEAVHEAAYHNDTLGRSLYISAPCIGTHSPEMLHQFVSSHFTGPNMAVVGVGVDHDLLVKYAQQNISASTMSIGSSASGAVAKKAAKYYGGGQQRIRTHNPIVHAAIVSEGLSLGSKDLMTLAVLQRVMGTGPYIKYSSNMATSRVTQAAAQATSNPYAATCLNLSYSDSGLFGFCVAGHYQDMGKILKTVVGQFSAVTKGGFTDQEVNRAKTQLKVGIAMDLESSANLAVELGSEALVSGGIYTLEEINQAIDKITTTDVQNIAKKVVNNKPSMAAVGNLAETPYLEDLL